MEVRDQEPCSHMNQTPRTTFGRACRSSSSQIVFPLHVMPIKANFANMEQMIQIPVDVPQKKYSRYPNSIIQRLGTRESRSIHYEHKSACRIS